MKKKAKKQQRPAKSKAQQAGVAEQPAAPDRRAFMNKVYWGGAALAVAGGATFFGARSVTAKMAEFDLSRVGQGLPSVVQVHDPTCPTCTALQRQTRKALRGVDSDALIYLVADIKTEEGQAFAGRFGVPHVTLLLFDGQGNHVDTLEGMRQADELQPVFEALVR